MKKIIAGALASILAIAVSTSIAQQTSVTVAVMPFYDTTAKKSASGQSERTASALTDELYRYKFIQLVERSRLPALMEESKLGMLGIVDEKSAPRLGKVRGVQIMVFGVIDRGRITARAVHMESQRIIASQSVTDPANISLLGSGIAAGIESFMMKERLKGMRNDNPSVNLRFWIEKAGGKALTAGETGRMRIGEKVVFKFRADTDGYLTIVDIQPGGDVVILFPNDATPSNKITGGTVYSIPSTDDAFEITVSEPAGQDYLVAFFTKKRVDWLDRKKLTGEGFWMVKDNEKGELARGFAVTLTGVKSSEWASRRLEVEVSK